MRKFLSIISLTLIVTMSCLGQNYNLNKRQLTEDELKSICDKELSLMRNEIFARQGYVFSNESLRDHFSQEPWYKPVADNKQIKFNAIEQSNIALIKQIEVSRQAKYKAIEDYFSKMKKAFATNDKTYINNVFSSLNSDERGETMDNLAKVMSKIDPTDINYYKNKGLYKVEEDNGYVVIVYVLQLEDNNIVVQYNYQRHSEIIEGFDDCSDYMSESEFACMWTFIISKDNNITFSRLDIAG